MFHSFVDMMKETGRRELEGPPLQARGSSVTRVEGSPEGAAVPEVTEAHRSPRWYAIVCVSWYFIGGRVWAHAGPCFSSQTMKNKCIFLHNYFQI